MPNHPAEGGYASKDSDRTMDDLTLPPMWSHPAPSSHEPPREVRAELRRRVLQASRVEVTLRSGQQFSGVVEPDESQGDFLSLNTHSYGRWVIIDWSEIVAVQGRGKL